MSMHGPIRTSDDMDQVPQRGGFGIGQRRRRHVRLCRLDVIATHRERERERERLIGNNTRPAKQVVEVEAVDGAVWVGNA